MVYFHIVWGSSLCIQFLYWTCVVDLASWRCESCCNKRDWALIAEFKLDFTNSWIIVPKQNPIRFQACWWDARALSDSAWVGSKVMGRGWTTPRDIDHAITVDHVGKICEQSKRWPWGSDGQRDQYDVRYLFLHSVNCPSLRLRVIDQYLFGAGNEHADEHKNTPSAICDHDNRKKDHCDWMDFLTSAELGCWRRSEESHYRLSSGHIQPAPYQLAPRVL